MTLILLGLMLWAIIGALVAFAFARIAGPC